MKHDIFISYSSKDSDVVHRYARHLEDAGYSVWYDVKGLHGGAQFSAEIVTAIENSRLVIFFSSANSNASEWTKGEILAAQSYSKPILPVKLDDAAYDKATMLVLLPLQYLVVNGYSRQLGDKLLAEVTGLIGFPTAMAQKQSNESAGGNRRSMALASVASALLSLLMMLVSGEFHLNLSLAIFTTVVSTACCIAMAYIIMKKHDWRERTTVQRVALVLSTLFFTSYTVMAFGLCFVGLKVFLLNSPSIVCSVLAIVGLMQLVGRQTRGYRLLWLSAVLFAIGSHWWVPELPALPLAIAVVSVIGLLSFRHLLKI